MADERRATASYYLPSLLIGKLRGLAALTGRTASQIVEEGAEARCREIERRLLSAQSKE
jgi:predicted DNA-binding protein